MHTGSKDTSSQNGLVFQVPPNKNVTTKQPSSTNAQADPIDLIDQQIASPTPAPISPVIPEPPTTPDSPAPSDTSDSSTSSDSSYPTSFSASKTMSETADVETTGNKMPILTPGSLSPEVLHCFENICCNFFHVKKITTDEQVTLIMGNMQDLLISDWYWTDQQRMH
jgi:hypothetical protein